MDKVITKDGVFIDVDLSGSLVHSCNWYLSALSNIKQHVEKKDGAYIVDVHSFALKFALKVIGLKDVYEDSFFIETCLHLLYEQRLWLSKQLERMNLSDLASKVNRHYYEIRPDNCDVFDLISRINDSTVAVVRSGLYNKRLVVTSNDLIIVGDPRYTNAITLISNNNTIFVYSCQKFAIYNIHISTRSESDNTVLFSNGSCKMINCTVTGSNIGSVMVKNWTTDVLIKGCSITNSLKSGLLCADHSKTKMIDSKVYGCGINGIEIKDASCEIINSVVTNSFHNGILVNEGGRLNIQLTTMSNNKINGLFVNKGSIIFQDCTFTKNRVGMTYYGKHDYSIFKLSEHHIFIENSYNINIIPIDCDAGISGG